MKESRDRQISLQPLSSSTQLQLSLLSPSQSQPIPQQQQQPQNMRTLTLTDTIPSLTPPQNPPIPNLIKNQKYSVLTFIPSVLYEQFKYFFNLFYLLTALSQFIPVLKVGLLFSFVAPLALVLFLTMLKEGYQDYQRFLKDKEINQQSFIVWYMGNRIEKKSCQLKVGDMIQVASGTSAPADCLLLHSFAGKGSIFIKTDQLDGQTDWKLRKSILPTEQIPSKFIIQYQAPQINIYKFLGSMTIQKQQTFGLNLENTVWRGVKIATGKALLLVIYTGKQTKLSLNMKDSGTKFGKLDEELNFFSKILFLVMVLLSFMLIVMKGFVGTPGEVFILFFKYFLLLSSIIPISMRVNLDFAKLFYKFMIDRDKNMTTPLCRNSNIPQQLGRIQFILSDKTGTLTQNQMIFRKLYLSQNCKYESDDTKTLIKIINSNIKPYNNLQLSSLSSKKRRTFDQQTIDSILALMICHNVTPVIEDDGTRVLQGSSPDQLTLVKFAEELGFKLKSRSEDFMEIVGVHGEVYEFQVLVVFPFTSESKRMGIVVKERGSSKIILYLKGADTVIQPKISSIDSDFMTQACSDLARQGLRTLVITQKLLSQQFYQEWRKQYNHSNAALKDREQKINKCRINLQLNMNFLAVTGVQDKLQDKVVQTVGSARSIGIKVWMLTGDKVQTAICVGRAVKLIQSQKEKLFVIQGITTADKFRQKIKQFYTYVGVYNQNQILASPSINCVLVIDGTSLKHALKDSQQQFFNIAIKLPAIICSRVSPTQKAEVASLVIKYNKSGGRVLGIGDGGNDVALIQSAHVGVGIYGKEGIQAALASDFSIGQFKDLDWLMYWHGRLAYKRSSLLAQFIIHRGVIITIMQIIFIIQFYFVPLPIYNGVLMLGYSTVFTMLPVFSLILDQDITPQISQKYPILYKTTQQGTQVSPQSFLYWMFISFYQGSIIMLLIIILLPNQSFYMTTTVSFTCLIIIQFLNVFTQINRIHIAQIISTLLSVVIYICSIFLMRNILNGVELFTTACFPITVFIVGVAWVPPFLFQVGKRCMYPSQEQKVMKQVQGGDAKDL